ncbi:uncharacterized protein FIBRA_04128 [Fibroporia radiculosa]|uniref:Serine aminopeptidase S33 domain-containing protein n=1 Tax=Fibroporia radiculosa TaxID=599839 RepID=J4HWD1_9APHY|nr:uncharacterized protein FIBRA_04128 [Fibroporia radiculosa]CCM02052.1 predicted protein [Fibroporia radiculosa]
MARYSEAWLIGPRSTNFYTRTYAAASSIASIVFIHGAAEHAGRYTDFHSSLAENGVTVFVYDQRGFGRTALDAEHKSKDSAYGRTCRTLQLEDLEWAVQHVRTQFNELPLFLMGFSMGGSLAFSFVSRDSPPSAKAATSLVSGIIGCAPTIHLTKPPSTIVRSVGRLVALVAPNMLVPVKNKTQDLSRNVQTNKAYVEDPLVGMPGSFRSVGDLISGGAALLDKDYQLWPPRLPLLILQGTADQVSDPASTQAFFDKLPVEDKKLVIYPDACHELHNEPVHKEVVSESVAFIKSHSSQIRSG